jgi:hypothetical protein
MRPVHPAALPLTMRNPQRTETGDWRSELPRDMASLMLLGEVCLRLAHPVVIP